MFFHPMAIPRIATVFFLAVFAQVLFSNSKKVWCGWILPIIFGIVSVYLVYRELNFAFGVPDYYAVAILLAAPVILLLLFYLLYFRRRIK